MNKRPFSSALFKNQQFQPSPKLKKQKLIDSINSLNLKINSINYKIIEKEIPKCAFTIINQQEKIIEQLASLLNIASDLLDDNGNFDNFVNKEQQLQDKENLNNEECSTSCNTDCVFDNSFDECISFLNTDSSNLITSSTHVVEPKELTDVSLPTNEDNAINSSAVFPSTPNILVDQNICIHESFMPNLQNYLLKWSEKSFLNFSDLLFQYSGKGQYFDVNCMVLSVMFTSHKKENNNLNVCPVYLQVCDGTKFIGCTKTFFPSEYSYKVQSDLFDGKLNYEEIGEYVHLICIFDEFAEQAKTIKAGDIIQLRNLNAKLFSSVNHGFSLRGLIDKSGIHSKEV
ncbi:POT1PC domain-containing protein [Meloidogyne graminicola]|uniref:POT1PC domain-containing protein n=1 Tax=Meloidogyne graminicola TaxID=189291 RepID=A0A8S9ZN34_9BILA|nr:POT1PC domain-containing protein [Meloidogyne graminicola]